MSIKAKEMKILMVCLGNICRSPLAEGILREKLKNLSKSGTVDSAGTAAYHIGSRPDMRSIKKAAENGISIENLRGRQFVSDDFERFDKIYAMDIENYNNIVQLAKNNEEKSKVKLILNEISPDGNSEVPDPYYGGESGFEHVYQLLNSACDSIIKKYF